MNLSVPYQLCRNSRVSLKTCPPHHCVMVLGQECQCQKIFSLDHYFSSPPSLCLLLHYQEGGKWTSLGKKHTKTKGIDTVTETPPNKTFCFFLQTSALYLVLIITKIHKMKELCIPSVVVRMK